MEPCIILKNNLHSSFLVILMICQVIWLPIAHGQWHKDFTTFEDIEYVSQIQNDLCGEISLWTGIRKGVNGNSNFDQIVIGFVDQEGEVLPGVQVFPTQQSSYYKLYDELNLIAVHDPATGVCDGYVLTFSAAQSGNDYKLHVVRLDQYGQIACDVAPLENHGASDFIHDVLQDKDGSLLMVGHSWYSGSPDLLLLRMDVQCNALNADRHIMIIDQNNNQSFGLDIEFYNSPLDPKKSQYIIAGKIGKYSMLTLAGADLTISSPLAWDLDMDGMHSEKAISIIERGGVNYVVGEGEDPMRRKYTYFMAVDYQNPQEPIFSHVTKYYLSNLPNYPTSVANNRNSDGLIVSGVIDEDPMSTNPLHHPYLMELNYKGGVIASSMQQGSHEYGRMNHVIQSQKDEYRAVGSVWNGGEYPSRDFMIVTTDISLQANGTCSAEISDSTVQPEIAILNVAHDALSMDPDVVNAFIQVEDTKLDQKYCYSLASYNCSDAELKAIIIYSNNGGNYYSFSVGSTINYGLVLSHAWAIYDGANNLDFSSNTDPMNYYFLDPDNYTIQLALKAILPDNTICRDTAELMISIPTNSYVADFCPDSVHLTPPWIYPGTYAAVDYISVTGKAMNGVDSLLLYAGKTIDLKVEVEQGDQLLAEIRSCISCCESPDPLQLMPWIYEELEPGNYGMQRFILEESCVYQFIARDSLGLKLFYDCEGELICQSEEGDGLIDCPFVGKIKEVQGINPCVHVE